MRAQGWGQVWVVFLLVGVKACYQTHLLVCVCMHEAGVCRGGQMFHAQLAACLARKSCVWCGRYTASAGGKGRG